MASSIKSAMGRTLERASLRSVFVKVVPMPASLTERRVVLRSLQRHGGIDVFKRLANPSSFIAVAASKAVADDLVRRSPMQFRFADTPLDLVTAGMPGTSLPPAVAAPADPVGLTSGGGGGGRRPQEPHRPADAEKTFTVHVFPNDGYKHKAVIRKSPLYGAWPAPSPPAKTETFVYAALSKAVPRGVAAEGLCDWRTGGQPGAPEEQLGGGRGSAAAPSDLGAFIEARVQRRERRQRAQGTSVLAELKSLAALRPKDPAAQAGGEQAARARAHGEGAEDAGGDLLRR